MKKYNFDIALNRKNTDSIKYDAIEKIWGVKDGMPLWVADMDFATPDFIIEAIKKRLEHPVLGYSFKNSQHLESISRWIKKRHNFDVSTHEISGSPGVVAGLSMAIQEFTKPGDKIIIQPPVYFPFSHIIKESGRKLVYNPLQIQEGNIQMDIEDLAKKIDKETKMILLCNPHNPGGRAWTKEELSQIDHLAQRNNLLVVSDEIHADILLNGHTYTPYASVSDYAAHHSITFGAPSKTFNIPGLATSFMIAKNPEIKKRYDKVLELYHLQKGNLLGNIALTAAYTQGEAWLDQLLEYLQKNLNLVEDFFKKQIPQIKVYRPEASFLVWLDCRNLGLNDEELKDLFFNKAGVILNPGYTFGPGGEGFMRMNIALPREKLKKALNKIKKAIKSL
jgi:cystathionine beta-lyase